MKEYIQKLRAFADKLDELEQKKSQLLIGEPLTPINISHPFWKKEDLVWAIRNIGGKWTKQLIGREDADYCMIQFTSDRYPLVFSIMRDKVCTKKVTYDCKPIFAPGEDDALVEEVTA